MSLAAALAWLARPVDGAGVAALRALFGLVLAASALRSLAYGWVSRLYLAPRHALHYAGFAWVPRPSAPVLYAVFAGLVASALALAAGYRYRLAAWSYFVLFTYVELLDASVYLNHYYLVSLLALLFAALPFERTYTLDARRGGTLRAHVPAWSLYALRVQIGLVYGYAGVAKLGGDWLVRAQPLRLWLGARGDWPLVGPLLARVETAYLFSYAGAVFDLTVVLALALRRTRLVAYAAVLVFHALTGLLFPIGVFPLLMSVAALVFFDPSWPRDLARRLLRRALDAPQCEDAPPSRPALVALVGVHLAVQVLLPLRHWALTRDVNWTQEHARFAWRVMLVERVGALEYRVLEPATGRRWRVDPRAYFEEHQVHELAMQADLIAEGARVVARALQARGAGPLRVYADSFVAHNGRPSARYLDPTVDLLAAPPRVLPRAEP